MSVKHDSIQLVVALFSYLWVIVILIIYLIKVATDYIYNSIQHIHIHTAEESRVKARLV